MAITSINRTRQGETVIIEVISDLAGTVYFHWWIDGAYVTQTLSGRMEFQVGADEQSRITVHDTTDANFDPLSSGQAPRLPPGRVTAAWYKSLEADVAHYEVWQQEQNVAVPPFELVAKIPHDPDRWLYTYLSPRITGYTYNFEIVPVDKYGNRGASMVQTGDTLTIAQPIAPNWVYVWEFVGAGTRKVTYAEAA